MPKKQYEPLPESLRYLQPFVNRLAKLPPEDVNEDVDPSPLEAAVRKRVRGLGQDSAEIELERDRDVLSAWLECSASENHPAHLIWGFFSDPGELARSVLRPPERAPHRLTSVPVPIPRGPEISLDAPAGWKVKKKPFGLDLKKGKLIGHVGALDEGQFRFSQAEFRARPSYWPGSNAHVDTVSFSCGVVAGTKFVVEQTVPVRMKIVRYLLTVPGGLAVVQLSSKDSEFDEMPFEARLGTLRFSPAN